MGKGMMFYKSKAKERLFFQVTEDFINCIKETYNVQIISDKDGYTVHGNVPTQAEMYAFVVKDLKSEEHCMPWMFVQKKGVYAKKAQQEGTRRSHITTETVVVPSDDPCFAFNSPWLDANNQEHQCLVALHDYVRVDTENQEVYSMPRHEFDETHERVPTNGSMLRRASTKVALDPAPKESRTRKTPEVKEIEVV